MAVVESGFGKAGDGTPVRLYALTGGKGLTATVTTYGATLTQLHVPDRHGRPGNIILGFDRIEGYLADTAYLGSTIGRYANRIAGGRFSLDGREHRLTVNNSGNTLHGGVRGFDKMVWDAKPIGESAVQFRCMSRDGENGFPGTLTAEVTFELAEPLELRITYLATTDAPTHVNLTNHSYFNLRGPGSGDILDHVLTIAADRYTPGDDTLIPTGEILPVAGTPLDFTSPQKVGRRIAQVSGGGYDHNFVLVAGGGSPRLAARVYEESTGRVMEVLTTQPGLQLYTGNFLGGGMKGIGGAYEKHGALCLETQHFPDSPNHPQFPSTILRPGQTYRHMAVYRFSAQ